MELKITKFNRLLYLSTFILLIASGCASFAGKELPIYASDQVATPERKISATYDVKAFFADSENMVAAAKIDKEIQKVVAASQVFEQLNAGAGHAEFHYSFVFRNEGMPPMPLAVLNGVLSGLTLTIIPGYARDIYILTVEVKQGDQLLKTYRYRDHVDSWIQLFLVVLTPSRWPMDVQKSVIDNMLMNFVHDFSIDMHNGLYLAKQAN